MLALIWASLPGGAPQNFHCEDFAIVTLGHPAFWIDVAGIFIFFTSIQPVEKPLEHCTAKVRTQQRAIRRYPHNDIGIERFGRRAVATKHVKFVTLKNSAVFERLKF